MKLAYEFRSIAHLVKRRRSASAWGSARAQGGPPISTLGYATARS